MAIYRSSDSLSRCNPDQYASMYDVRKRHDLKNKEITIATPSTKKDTLEISREQLKEEALSRLRHTSQYIIPQNSFMRVGKYLFLAIALPPCFLVYHLPKWILVEAIPALISVLTVVGEKIAKRLKREIATLTSHTSRVTHACQAFCDALMKRVVSFVLEMQQSFLKLKMGAMRLFQFRMNTQIKEKLKELKNIPLRLKEKGAMWIRNIQVNIQDCVQAALTWGQTAFLKLQSRFWKQLDEGQEGFKKAFQLADEAIESVFNISSNGLNAFKAKIAPYFPPIRFCAKQLQRGCTALLRGIQKKWEEKRDSFSRKHKRTLVFLESLQEKLKRRPKLLDIQEFLQGLIPHAWMKKLPAFVRKMMLRGMSHRSVAVVCHIGLKIALKIAERSVKGVLYTLQFTGRSVAFVHNKLFQGGSLLLRLVHPLFKWVQKGWEITLRGGYYLLYYICLFLVMLVILLGLILRYLSASITLPAVRRRNVNI